MLRFFWRVYTGCHPFYQVQQQYKCRGTGEFYSGFVLSVLVLLSCCCSNLVGPQMPAVWLLCIMVFDIVGLIISVQTYDNNRFSATHLSADLFFAGLCFITIFCIPVKHSQWLCCKQVAQSGYFACVLFVSSLCCVSLCLFTLGNYAVPDCLSIPTVSIPGVLTLGSVSLATACNAAPTAHPGKPFIVSHALAKVGLICACLCIMVWGYSPFASTWNDDCAIDQVRYLH